MRERVHLLCCALAIGALGQAASASMYAFDWTRPSQTVVDANATGPYSYQIDNTEVGDLAGQLNAITATYDSDAGRLTFSLNIGAPALVGQILGGFSLVLTNGAMPDGPGQWTSYYFDASGISPVLTGYAYNGHPWSPSYEDGSWLPGVQAPDPIFSSLNDVDGVVNNATDNEEVDGTHTWAFDINVASILSHSPLYPQPWAWDGTGFDDEIGLWLKTFTNVHTTYDDDGFVAGACYSPKSGYYDTDHQPTVPAPGAGALLALAALCGRSRKRRVD